jgi:hypothetical protein
MTDEEISRRFNEVTLRPDGESAARSHAGHANRTLSGHGGSTRPNWQSAKSAATTPASTCSPRAGNSANGAAPGCVWCTPSKSARTSHPKTSRNQPAKRVRNPGPNLKRYPKVLSSLPGQRAGRARSVAHCTPTPQTRKTHRIGWRAAALLSSYFLWREKRQ